MKRVTELKAKSMAIKNPRKWRFTWEAQSHSPTLKLYLFDCYTNPSNQCHELKVDLNLSQSLVSVTWIQQEDKQNQVSLLVPIPKVLINSDSPISYRALTDHIEVKLLLLLPVDHPIVSSIDSVLHLTEDAQISESDAATPLVMDSDIKSLSAKEEGVHFYCRSCSTRLTRRPVREFVEMPSVNWQEVADNWFGGCCCSFGGISEKLVTRYANSYICVNDMCLLNYTTVTLFKDDLEGCKFPDCNDNQKCQSRLDFTVEHGPIQSTQDSANNHERFAGFNLRSDAVHDFSADLKCEMNEEESSRNNFCVAPLCDLSENMASSPGCGVNTTSGILDNVDEGCKHTGCEFSPLEEKTSIPMELMADQRSFLNGFLGNIFMARSSNLSKDIEWTEFVCPHCSSLLGAYPCGNGDRLMDGGVRLFKCYISTCLPVGGSQDIFRKYTLERMFTNQLLESAKDELSFRTVVRDLKNKSPMVQIVLLNPNCWFCTGNCLRMDNAIKPIPKLDLHPAIKVLFSDCSNLKSQPRMLEDWLTQNLADEVFMLTHQIEELIENLTSLKNVHPPSCTSIQGLHLASVRR